MSFPPKKGHEYIDPDFDVIGSHDIGIMPFIDFFRKTPGKELYAFTVKILKNPKKADEKDYEPFFKLFYLNAKVLSCVGEADPKGVLHYHGVIRIPKKYYRKGLIVKGYHLKLVKIYDVAGWINYCYKNDIYHCFEESSLL